MIYIRILNSFKDIHTKEIYTRDKFLEVTEERYKEIIANSKKAKKELIRLATEEEIAKNFPVEITDEEVSNVNIEETTDDVEEYEEASEEQEKDSDSDEVTEDSKDVEVEETKEATEDSEEQEEPKTNKKTNSRRK